MSGISLESFLFNDNNYDNDNNKRRLYRAIYPHNSKTHDHYTHRLIEEYQDYQKIPRGNQLLLSIHVNLSRSIPDLT